MSKFNPLDVPNSEAIERNRFIHNEKVRPAYPMEVISLCKQDKMCCNGDGSWSINPETSALLTCYCGMVHMVVKNPDHTLSKCCTSTCGECFSALLWQGAEKL